MKSLAPFKTLYSCCFLLALARKSFKDRGAGWWYGKLTRDSEEQSLIQHVFEMRKYLGCDIREQSDQGLFCMHIMLFLSKAVYQYMRVCILSSVTDNCHP